MNPKFDFYSKLLKLFEASAFDTKLAAEIISIYTARRKELSLPDVTIMNLANWHKQAHTFGDDDGLAKVEEFSKHCFRDLAPQIRNHEVLYLHDRWKDRAGESEYLHVHVRRLHRTGDWSAALTVVVDDMDKFRRFFANPEEFVRTNGKVHYSESKGVQENRDEVVGPIE